MDCDNCALKAGGEVERMLNLDEGDFPCWDFYPVCNPWTRTGFTPEVKPVYGDDIDKEFIKFLVRNNAYTTFMRNLAEGLGSWSSYRDTNKDVYILGAFVWSKTPEGHDTWSNLSDVWEEYLESL